MTKKKTDLLRKLVSKSIPVSQQTFAIAQPGADIPKEESDQYIVDGPALRELLQAYRWNYRNIKKHKDWVPTFHWNGPEVPKDQPVIEGENGDSPAAKAIWGGVGLVIVVLYILYHMFLKG